MELQMNPTLKTSMNADYKNRRSKPRSFDKDNYNVNIINENAAATQKISLQKGATTNINRPVLSDVTNKAGKPQQPGMFKIFAEEIETSILDIQKPKNDHSISDNEHFHYSESDLQNLKEEESEDMEIDNEEKGQTISEMENFLNNSILKFNGEKMLDNLALIEYQKDIYANLCDAEIRFMPRHDYMCKQYDITYSMRTILVDWLVEVAEEYNLEQETLFLTVSYIDRFLSKVSVMRGKLQLLGAAAMFHAAKYEEIHPPGVSDFVYITDDTYSTKQVILMERALFQVLQFNSATPTMHWFASYFLTQLSADKKLKAYTFYLLELSLLDGEKFLQFKPSVMATSALYLASNALQIFTHIDQIECISGYKFVDLVDSCQLLHSAANLADKAQQLAVFNKYMKEKEFYVAKQALEMPKVGFIL